ncbi:hypothetical protein [Streptomyces blattellae]|uniref:hypothetical protein n=1 Tax=Streptomyces blattellae TaxID=2569855 RepID=UPI0012B9C3F7|nr:hypothetical protein [Streptomyces blattellae]
MTHTTQEPHPASITRTTTAAPVAAHSRPINEHARAYAQRHGDPARWTTPRLRVYLDLGGAA